MFLDILIVAGIAIGSWIGILIVAYIAIAFSACACELFSAIDRWLTPNQGE